MSRKETGKKALARKSHSHPNKVVPVIARSERLRERRSNLENYATSPVSHEIASSRSKAPFLAKSWVFPFHLSVCNLQMIDPSLPLASLSPIIYNTDVLFLLSSMPDIAKIPPHNLEAEQSLLGSLLIDKDAIIKVGDVVTPDDFYRDAHGFIFETMLELFSRREPIDLLSLSNRLEEKKQLETIGGRSYIVSLTNTVPTASHVQHYAQIVRKKATLRRLIAASAEVSQMAYNEEDQDVEVVLDKAEQQLFRISQTHLKQAFIPISGVLLEAFDRIDEIHREKGKLRGIPTGFRDLDHLLAGFQKSDLVILAARPSVGKTSLALNFACNMAINSKTPVGIFSLEMSRDQIVDRFLCSQAEVDLWKMRTGRLSEREDDFPRIGHAMGVLSEAPIFIDDSSTANIMEIRTKARRLQMEHGLGFLIIDYLQLMEGRVNNPDNRVQEVAEITRGLKSIARELSIPVLALSQLNRGVELRSPAIPKLADLRESGSIEQDADVVMFIYRKKMDRSLKNLPLEEENIAEIYIEKHRNGPIGMVKLFFNERCSNFKTVETARVEGVPVPVA